MGNYEDLGGRLAHGSMFTRTGGGPLRRFLIKTDAGPPLQLLLCSSLDVGINSGASLLCGCAARKLVVRENTLCRFEGAFYL